jgi:hypothetical protein
VSVLVRSPSKTREYFLEAHAQPSVLHCCFPLATTGLFAGGFSFPAHLVVSRTFPIVRALCLLRPLIVISLGGTGIFNLFSIAYAFLPQLRGRLTQGRRALPWKPWVFGERDFHSFYRLLMPCILTSMRSSARFRTPSTPILRSPTT